MISKLLKNRNINSYYIKHEFYGKALVTFFGIFLIVLTLCLVIFIASKGLTTFTKDHVSVLDFLFSTKWSPDNKAGPYVGVLIFLVGSMLVSMIALILSVPLSISTAIFMTEISPRLGKKIMQPAIEIFMGIPSVVYGWVGLSIIVPFISRTFGGLGFSMLAGGLVLSVMIFPTITSVAADAFRALPKDFKEASYALGATRWQTIRKVLLPTAMPGILTGVVLGLARAFGEALAVQMVIGNAINLPKSLLDSSATLTSILTMDMGNTVEGTTWNNALWSMALLLLIISFLLIVLIHKIGSKRGAQK